MVSSNSLYIKGFLSKNHKQYGKNWSFTGSFHGRAAQNYRPQQRLDRHLAGQQVLHEIGGECFAPTHC